MSHLVHASNGTPIVLRRRTLTVTDLPPRSGAQVPVYLRNELGKGRRFDQHADLLGLPMQQGDRVTLFFAHALGRAGAGASCAGATLDNVPLGKLVAAYNLTTGENAIVPGGVAEAVIPNHAAQTWLAAALLSGGCAGMASGLELLSERTAWTLLVAGPLLIGLLGYAYKRWVSVDSKQLIERAIHREGEALRLAEHQERATCQPALEHYPVAPGRGAKQARRGFPERADPLMGEQAAGASSFSHSSMGESSGQWRSNLEFQETWQMHQEPSPA